MEPFYEWMNALLNNIIFGPTRVVDLMALWFNSDATCMKIALKFGLMVLINLLFV